MATKKTTTKKTTEEKKVTKKVATKKTEVAETVETAEVEKEEKVVRRNTYRPRSVLSSAIFDVINEAENIRKKFDKKLPELHENQFGYVDKDLAKTILSDENMSTLNVCNDLFNLRLAQKKIMINLSANIKRFNIKPEIRNVISEIGRDLTIKHRTLVQEELLGKVIRIPNRNCLSVITNVIYNCNLSIDEEELANVNEVTYEYKTHEIILRDAVYALPIVSVYNAETQEYIMSLNPVISIIDISYKTDEEGNQLCEEERINCTGFKFYNVYPIDLKEACLLNIVGI